VKFGARTNALLTYIFNGFVTHVPFREVRILWLRLLGVKCPLSVSVFRGVTVFGASNIVLGERVAIGYNVCLDGRGGIIIGHDTVVASHSHLITADHDVNCPTFGGRLAPVVVGHHCWICTRSLVLKGVVVGDFAVVAAGSVVTKSIFDYEIAGGNPAKTLRQRLCNADYRIPLHCDPSQP
jgi:putative colanic acid biosynthesis acetyltransferase WcaF